MRIRTALLELGVLLAFLAGSVYSYTLFTDTPPPAAAFPAREIYSRAVRPDIPPPGLSGRPRAPRALFPGEGAFFYNGPGNPGVCFSWEPLPGAASYTLRISARADLRDPLYTETVNAPSFTLKGERAAILPERGFYWAVMQTDLEGEVSPYCAPRSFSVGCR